MESVERINLLGLDGSSLSELVGQWGGKPFRARQLQRWMHQRGADSFDAMTDLANPTTNRIYQALGFRPVLDRLMVTFE